MTEHVQCASYHFYIDQKVTGFFRSLIFKIHLSIANDLSLYIFFILSLSISLFLSLSLSLFFSVLSDFYRNVPNSHFLNHKMTDQTIKQTDKQTDIQTITWTYKLKQMARVKCVSKPKKCPQFFFS